MSHLLLVAGSEESQALVVELVVDGEMLLEVIASGEPLVAVMSGAERAMDGFGSAILGIDMTLQGVQSCERLEADAHEGRVPGALVLGMHVQVGAGGKVDQAGGALVAVIPEGAVDVAIRIPIVASKVGQ